MNARELLDALEMRMGSMDHKRVLAKAAEDREIVEIVESVCQEFSSERWFETTFHPIDESDPMLQVTKSLKW